MLDLISGFAGMVFAWGVLGFMLLLPAIYGEYLTQCYVKYATDGEVKMPRKLDEWLGGCFFKRGEPTRWFVVLLIVLMVVTVGIITGHDNHGLSASDSFIFGFFGMWVVVGVWAWPAVMLGVAMFLPTFISRKVFRLKRKFEQHVASKNAHQGE